MKINKKLVLITFVISFIVLIFLSILQAFYSKFLWLETKWIIVSGIPLLVGILYSGILKTFKGFGIELETNLSEKIELNLIGLVECFLSPDLPKDSRSVLSKLSMEQKFKTERLQFKYKKLHYYNAFAVLEYIKQLPNLKYIEVVDEEGRFIALIYASKFQESEQFHEDQIIQRIELLIKSIENGDISNNFFDVITHTIKKDDTLLQALKRFNDSLQGKTVDGDQKLPVVDSNDKMIGLTRKIKLTEKIADQVLKSER